MIMRGRLLMYNLSRHLSATTRKPSATTSAIEKSLPSPPAVSESSPAASTLTETLSSVSSEPTIETTSHQEIEGKY